MMEYRSRILSAYDPWTKITQMDGLVQSKRFVDFVHVCVLTRVPLTHTTTKILTRNIRRRIRLRSFIQKMVRFAAHHSRIFSSSCPGKLQHQSRQVIIFLALLFMLTLPRTFRHLPHTQASSICTLDTSAVLQLNGDTLLLLPSNARISSQFLGWHSSNYKVCGVSLSGRQDSYMRNNGYLMVST